MRSNTPTPHTDGPEAKITHREAALTIVTADEIDAARTARGGWTKETLAQWGIAWPPPRGWRKRLLSDGESPEKTPELRNDAT